MSLHEKLNTGIMSCMNINECVNRNLMNAKASIGALYGTSVIQVPEPKAW